MCHLVVAVAAFVRVFLFFFWALWLVVVVVGSDMGWICNGVVVGFNRVVVRYRFFGFGFCCCGFGWILWPVVVVVDMRLEGEGRMKREW